jgi:hypothetical protein
MFNGYGDESPYSNVNPSGDSVKFDKEVKARVGDYKTI